MRNQPPVEKEKDGENGSGAQNVSRKEREDFLLKTSVDLLEREKKTK